MLICDALRQSTGAGTKVHVQKCHLAGKACLNIQIWSWGFPKIDGRKFKIMYSMDSETYPTTLILKEQEWTLLGMYHRT